MCNEGSGRSSFPEGHVLLQVVISVPFRAQKWISHCQFLFYSSVACIRLYLPRSLGRAQDCLTIHVPQKIKWRVIDNSSSVMSKLQLYLGLFWVSVQGPRNRKRRSKRKTPLSFLSHPWPPMHPAAHKRNNSLLSTNASWTPLDSVICYVMLLSKSVEL